MFGDQWPLKTSDIIPLDPCQLELFQGQRPDPANVNVLDTARCKGAEEGPKDASAIPLEKECCGDFPKQYVLYSPFLLIPLFKNDVPTSQKEVLQWTCSRSLLTCSFYLACIDTRFCFFNKETETDTV